MTEQEIEERLAERLKCEAEHMAFMAPHTGFGWSGSRCSQCGFMFFKEWTPHFIDPAKAAQDR